MNEFFRYQRNRIRVDPLAAEKVLDLANLMIAGLIVGLVLGEDTVNIWGAAVFLIFAILMYFVILSLRK